MSNDAFYLELREEVREAIEEYGAEFEAVSAGVTDLQALDLSSGDRRKVNGLIIDGAIQSFINVGVIDWNSNKSLMLPHTANINHTDSIIVGNESYNCSKVSELKPGNVVIAYLMSLER